MVSWAEETTLDVEYAHALAPGASILLAETPTSENEGASGLPQIVTAEEYVMDHGLGAVISQSFGATEETFSSYAQIRPLRAAYLDADSHHVTVLAASGDAGANDYTANRSDFYTRRVTSWPDSDPLVTASAAPSCWSPAAHTPRSPGTTPTTGLDEYWGGSTDPDPLASGGGTSEYFARPSYQDRVEGVAGASRGVPDVAMSGAATAPQRVRQLRHRPGGLVADLRHQRVDAEYAAMVALADQVAGRSAGLLDPPSTRCSPRARRPDRRHLGDNTVSFRRLGDRALHRHRYRRSRAGTCNRRRHGQRRRLVDERRSLPQAAPPRRRNKAASSFR